MAFMDLVSFLNGEQEPSLVWRVKIFFARIKCVGITGMVRFRKLRVWEDFKCQIDLHGKE